MEDEPSRAPLGTPSFLELGRTGRASLWRYLLGTVLLAVSGLVLSAVPLLLVVVVAWSTGIIAAFDWDTMESGHKLVDFVALNAMFPVIWVGVFVAIRLVHRRSFHSVVTASPTIRWRRIGLGAAAWLVAPVVLTAIDMLRHPELFQVTFQPRAWLLLAALALVLTPIQTTAEELGFRGYLLQAAAPLTRHPWLALVPSTVLFTLLHAENPEFQADRWIGWVPYCVAGLVWAAATLRDNGMELALGAHAANNLFAFLVVDQVGSVGGFGAIFTYMVSDPAGSAVGEIITAVAFWLLVFVLPDLLRRLRSARPRGLSIAQPTPKRPAALAPGA